MDVGEESPVDSYTGFTDDGSYFALHHVERLGGVAFVELEHQRYSRRRHDRGVAAQ